MTTVNEAADIISGTYGQLTITYRRLVYTWTVTVYLGGILRVEELCATYDNAHAAWTEARRIARAAHQGKTVAQIEAEKPSELALAETKRIIEGVAANMDAVVEQRQADAAQLAVDAQQIVATGRGFNAYRQDTTTRAANTTEAQDRVITQADERGYIRRGKTASIRQLIALERMGLVKLDRRKQGRHWVTYGATLTAKAEKMGQAA